MDAGNPRLIDLSHVIEERMTTFKGFPGPTLCDFWTREASAAHYDDGSSFQIGRVDMVANTGTSVDSPFHRYADGADLAALPLEHLTNLDGAPDAGFRFSAEPPKVKGMGTFPVRAYARVDG